MEKLPTEIFQTLMTYIAADDTFATRCDLSSLRQTSRTLSMLIAPNYFDTIPLWMSMRHLENINSISENEQLCKYVRKIEFSPLQIRITPSQEALAYYEEQCHTLNDRDLCYAKYKLACRTYDSAGVVQDCQTNILTRAFRRLQNLREIKIVIGSRRVGALELTRAFPKMFSINFDYSAIRTINTLLTAHNRSKPRLRSFDLGRYSDLCYDDFDDRVFEYSREDRGSYPELVEPSIRVTSINRAMRETFLQISPCDSLSLESLSRQMYQALATQSRRRS